MSKYRSFKLRRVLGAVLVGSFFSLIAKVAEAGSSQGITYQGRIIRPDGNPANSGVITFTLKVMDATNNCRLWSETQVLSMNDTNGTFALVIGAGTRTDGGSQNLKQVFMNAGTLSSLSCTSGTSYTPGASDDRNLVVSFDDAGTAVTLSAVAIKSVPFALQADQVSGYGILNLAKISGVGSANTMTGTQFDFLTSLAAPANVTSTPCAANDTLKYVGGVWTCAAAGGGGGSSSTSGLTAATATNSIDNTNFAQTWSWSTATTENPMSIAANSITTGSLMNLTTSSASVNSTNGLLNVANTSATTTGVLARFQSNSTAGSGLTVLANGNVGIGTSTPTKSLEVAPGATDGAILGRMYVGGWAGGVTEGAISHYSLSGAIADYALLQNSSGRTALNSRSTQPIQFTIGNVEKMRLNMDGNVGIGTATPNSTLSVSGNVVVGDLTLNSASGSNSMAVGTSVTANAGNAIAFGNGGTASGAGSFVANYLGQAAGVNSAAFGEWNYASSKGQFSIGTNGLSLGGSATTWVATDPLFTIGNGSSSGSRSNAMTVLKNGNVGIGTTSPNTQLDITGAFSQRGMAAPAVSVAGEGRIYFDSTANKFKVSENNGAYADLVNGGGGSSTVSGIGAATGTNTIDNTNYAQTWNWSTATAQNPMSLSANALTTGSILNLTTSSASFNSTNGLINVANTGAATTGILARFQSNSTAGSGLTVLANGNVGIGTAAPSTKLDVSGATRSLPVIINTGGIVDLSLSNIFKLKDVQGSTISLSNPASGGTYTLYVSDLTSRTYTFSGCTNTFFNTANGATQFRSAYTILVIVDGPDTDCIISWQTGFN
jgi:trimeric autotransporter adhesin